MGVAYLEAPLTRNQILHDKWPRYLARLLLGGRFAHLAWTALRALSERSSGVMFAARARPPFLPPSRPSATAAVFLRFAMASLYVSGYERQERIRLTNT
jgi:hypothetical protein